MVSGFDVAGGWARQLRKGVLDLAILAHLKRGAVHGYALIQALKAEGLMASDGAEATVYQALQRLAKTGAVQAAWSSPEGAARPRKVYQITAAGTDAHQGMMEAWTDLRRAVQRLEEEP